MMGCPANCRKGSSMVRQSCSSVGMHCVGMVLSMPWAVATGERWNSSTEKCSESICGVLVCCCFVFIVVMCLCVRSFF